MSKKRISRSTLGVVTLEENLHDDKNSSSQEYALQRFVWHPSEQLTRNLPVGTSISLIAQTDHQGLRTFYPEHGWGMYHPWAWLAGLAILTKTEDLSPELLCAYRIMHFLYQRVKTSRLYRGRDLTSLPDLNIKRSGRGGGINADIFPEDLGKTAAGEGRKWSIEQLLEAGRTRAHAAGINNCDPANAISFGLLAAAEKNPLSASTKDITFYMRAALFADSDNPTPSKKVLSRVYGRVVDWFQQHQEDTLAQFEATFAGPKNNIAKTLAKKRTPANEQLDIATVQAALLELGWQSYQYEANCLNAFAQAFEALLPQPLNNEENKRFAILFKRQPFLGNLTLPLVRDRIPLLRPILPLLIQQPTNRFLRQVVARMLHSFAEMSNARRIADRQIKRVNGVKTARGMTVNHLSDDNTINACVKVLAEGVNLRCQNIECHLEYSIHTSHSKKQFMITAHCCNHGGTFKKTITVSQARKIIKAFQDSKQ